MGNRFGVAAAIAEALRQLRKFSGRLFGQRLPGLARLQAFGIGEDPFEFLADVGVPEVIKAELVNLRNAIRPIGMYTEPVHIADDQQRRIFQRQGVLLKLGEGGI